MKKTKTKKAAKPVKIKSKKPVVKAKAIVAKAKPVKAVEEEPLEPKQLKLAKADAAKFKKLLLDLRDHLIDGVNFLATDNLKRSHREASGELSGSSLHMADAGTDNFDREFALSLVSSEQEAFTRSKKLSSVSSTAPMASAAIAKNQSAGNVSKPCRSRASASNANRSLKRTIAGPCHKRRCSARPMTRLATRRKRPGNNP